MPNVSDKLNRTLLIRSTMKIPLYLTYRILIILRYSYCEHDTTTYFKFTIILNSGTYILPKFQITNTKTLSFKDRVRFSQYTLLQGQHLDSNWTKKLFSCVGGVRKKVIWLILSKNTTNFKTYILLGVCDTGVSVKVLKNC